MKGGLRKMENKVLLAIVGIALLVFGGFLGAVAFPTEVEKVVEVEKLVPFETIKEVPVDNGNLALLEKYIYDNDGNLSELEVTELDEDEMPLLIDRINFIEDIKVLALEEVKANVFDKVDGEEVEGVKLDEDELERLNLDDDEISVSVTDFEDKDATVTVPGSFKQYGNKYDFTAKVEFEDGEIEDLKIEQLAKISG